MGSNSKKRPKLPGLTAHQTRLVRKYPMIPWAVIERLTKIESSNRSRAKKMRKKFGHPTLIKRTDFVKICWESNFKCSLCGEAIDPMIMDPLNDRVLSLEHDIALSGGGTHEKENISCAHRACNMAKNEAHDKSAAAKVKRMAGETGQYARRKRNGSRLKSRGFGKSKRKIPSRKFGKPIDRRL